jgi:hypothetical protein
VDFLKYKNPPEISRKQFEKICFTRGDGIIHSVAPEQFIQYVKDTFKQEELFKNAVIADYSDLESVTSSKIVNMLYWRGAEAWIDIDEVSFKKTVDERHELIVQNMREFETALMDELGLKEELGGRIIVEQGIALRKEPGLAGAYETTKQLADALFPLLNDYKTLKKQITN